MKNIFSFLTIWFFVFIFTQKAEAKNFVIPDKDTLIQNFEMNSSFVEDKFIIDVSLPESYFKDPDRKYPVLYLTDGNWRRGQHKPIHEMAMNENVQEMILVGICYPEGYKVEEIRVRDFIVRADKFLDFIINELIPQIEKRFRTTGIRTLWGSSFGGYFALYTLFKYNSKTKEVFQNYIVASAAALEHTNYLGQPLDIFGYEQLHFQKSNELKVNLYLTVGGNEDAIRFLNPFKKLVSTIESRNYKGLQFSSFINPGKDHFTVWEPSLYDGIRLYLKKN